MRFDLERLQEGAHLAECGLYAEDSMPRRRLNCMRTCLLQSCHGTFCMRCKICMQNGWYLRGLLWK